MTAEQARQGSEPEDDGGDFVLRQVHIEKPAVENEYDDARETTLEGAARRSGRGGWGGRGSGSRWLIYGLDGLAVGGSGAVRVPFQGRNGRVITQGTRG